METKQTDLIKEREAAEMLGVTVNFLRVDRAKPAPAVPFVRISANTSRYSRRALAAFIERNTVGATA
jgi:hypothetical protein